MPIMLSLMGTDEALCPSYNLCPRLLWNVAARKLDQLDSINMFSRSHAPRGNAYGNALRSVMQSVFSYFIEYRTGIV